MTRLGRGGTEANRRMQEALNALAPLAAGLLEPTEGIDRLEAEGIYPTSQPTLFKHWSGDLQEVVRGARLTLELQPPKKDAVGGRRGKHSAAFLPLLDELTEVYRIEPEAAW